MRERVVAAAAVGVQRRRIPVGRRRPQGVEQVGVDEGVLVEQPPRRHVGGGRLGQVGRARLPLGLAEPEQADRERAWPARSGRSPGS